MIGLFFFTGSSLETLASHHLFHCPLMSQESPEIASGTRRPGILDTSEEIDANIRNFAPVARIMKNALPDNAKIAKEAKECMQECVSEFISFITSEGKS